MPQVPESTLPRVAPEGLPRVNAPAETFGGGAAARAPDLQPLAGEVTNIYQQEKQKADEIAQTDFGSKLSALETQLTVATKQRLGKDAFGAPEDVAEQWNAGADKIGEGVTNDAQKIAFGRMRAMHEEALNSTVQHHVAQQRMAYDSATTEAYVANERSAGLSSGDPDRVGLSITNQQIAIAKQMDRIGASADVAKEQLALAASSTHVGYIQQLVDEHRIPDARAYLEQHRDAIVGQQIGAVDKLVKTGSILGQAYEHFDAIRTGSIGENGLIDEKAAVDKVDAIADPEVRRETETLVRQRIGEQKTEQLVKRRDLDQQAGDAIEIRGNVRDIPTTVWDQLTEGTRSRMRREAKRIAAGDPIVTDPETYYNLRMELGNPALRGQALKLNLLDYQDKLAKPQFDELANLQSGLQKGDQTAVDKANHFYSNDSIVNDAIKGAGIGVGLTSPITRKADAETSNALRQKIGEQVTIFQKNSGREATNDEVTKIANDVLTKHIVSEPGAWWGRNDVSKRLDQMGPGDELVVRSKDIPRADYRAIVQRLRSTGQPLTDDNVIAEYKKSLMKLKNGR